MLVNPTVPERCSGSCARCCSGSCTRMLLRQLHQMAGLLQHPRWLVDSSTKACWCTPAPNGWLTPATVPGRTPGQKPLILSTKARWFTPAPKRLVHPSNRTWAVIPSKQAADSQHQSPLVHASTQARWFIPAPKRLVYPSNRTWRTSGPSR
jgi:hypothetical protein